MGLLRADAGVWLPFDKLRAGVVKWGNGEVVKWLPFDTSAALRVSSSVQAAQDWCGEGASGIDQDNWGFVFLVGLVRYKGLTVRSNFCFFCA